METREAIRAEDRLVITYGTGHAIAASLAEKKHQGPLKRDMQKLVKLAYPEVHPYA